MKGVILLGGNGTRLRPLTYILPKSLIPVYDRPLALYPLSVLIRGGIKDIVVVTAEEQLSRFRKFLGNGSSLGIRLEYVTQEKPLGIAHAVGMAEPYCKGSKIAVALGDNIFEDDLNPAIKAFQNQKFKKGHGFVSGAKLVLKHEEDPRRFGVAELDGDIIVDIVEKPENPKSNWITTGFYMFDERAFDVIKTLKPSGRGEIEITDLANFYVREGTATHEKLKKAWFDVGTIESRHEAAHYIFKRKDQFFL
jgi:glucose-1-phosphate thymidylyltransferase